MFHHVPSRFHTSYEGRFCFDLVLPVTNGKLRLSIHKLWFSSNIFLSFKKRSFWGTCVFLIFCKTRHVVITTSSFYGQDIITIIPTGIITIQLINMTFIVYTQPIQQQQPYTHTSLIKINLQKSRRTRNVVIIIILC